VDLIFSQIFVFTGGNGMGIFDRIRETLRYVSEAVMSIFRPADEYPKIGVQPFDGDPYSEWLETHS
jgi:hypothetical protein